MFAVTVTFLEIIGTAAFDLSSGELDAGGNPVKKTVQISEDRVRSARRS